ncbi:carbamoyltransferase HypF [Sulfurimonas sp. NWX79]|uniref:carbamoyltransferase HypF n=1 Tax=Sulfurimonas sp. NWX79 TaxID=2925412 RepID=UPI00320495DC
MSAASIFKKRIRLNIYGIVQGVGFRPFIFNLANEFGLHGFVTNSGDGVIVEIEGDDKSLQDFIKKLLESPPLLAKIVDIKEKQIDVKNDNSFCIEDSKASKRSTMLSADISLCDDCRKEIDNPKDRRYKYPFINCINCGPRYTIIKELPYDRKNTSMQKFEMCDECQIEYENPQNRRYHAQPISCHNCGPKLQFIDISNKGQKYDDHILDRAIEKLDAGASIALKGLGGFHIICDATNSVAVATLRINKHRPTKPLAVMFSSLYDIKKVAKLTKKDEALITSKERPIVIVTKKETSVLAEEIAPGIDRIGVFLPYTPLHELLLKKMKRPIVATSANISDEPIITELNGVLQKLPLVVDGIITHDREIINACDDSVVMNVADRTIFLRLARGYGPKSFYHPNKIKRRILAVGANQKSTLTLAFENNIIISPHIGDLNSLNAFEYFTRTLDTLQRVYDFKPDVIVCDKHPNYETTRWAKEYISENPEVNLIEIQHHFAHALSVMAEYELSEETLAFCFDGTGYGDDNTLWGGEVLLASPTSYTRAFHLQEIYLLGGEKAIKQPKRVGLSLLFDNYTIEEVLSMEHPLVKSFTPEEIKTLYIMFQKKINTPTSSSIGRLFDAVYALSGFVKDLGYEGESGLIMEGLAQESNTKESYSYIIEDDTIYYKPMLDEILQETNREIIAAKFLNTLCNIILEIVEYYPKLPVILSGGVFQNKFLVHKLVKSFDAKKIRYYISSTIPVNDGNISLGQAYYGIHKVKEKNE